MRLHNRVQVLKLLNQHLGVYPTPMNLNWNWSWGSLSGLLLGSQIVTGILLAMHYVGHVDHAFASVQHLMVDVPSGVIIRYAHANGASLFFTVVYLHVLRGLYYSSGTQPREILWISGVIILLLMIITAFIGYSHSLTWIFNELYTLYYVIFIDMPLFKEYGTSIYTFYVVGIAQRHLPLGDSQIHMDLILGLNTMGILLNSKDGVKLNIKPIKSYDNLHLKQIQYDIVKDNKQKACIYLIYNKINGNSYIGSAISNRISMRFRNHCIHNTGGNKPLTRAINKYGLNNFSFHILEYYPGFVIKENFNKNHIKLLELETSYLLKYKPIYNILLTAGSSVGLKHSEQTINKIKSNYSQERKDFIGNLNKGKELSDLTKKLISEKRIELFKNTDFKTRFLLEFKHTLFKPKKVFLYDSKGMLISDYESIKRVSQVFSCDRKTVRKYLDNPTKMFKNIGYLKTV